MKIAIHRIELIEDAFLRLKEAPLDASGDERIPIYRNASVRLADFYPEELNPTSCYVLRKGLEVQRELRGIFLEKHRIDTFWQSAVLHYETEEGQFDLAPPV